MNPNLNPFLWKRKGAARRDQNTNKKYLSSERYEFFLKKSVPCPAHAGKGKLSHEDYPPTNNPVIPITKNVIIAKVLKFIYPP